MSINLGHDWRISPKLTPPQFQIIDPKRGVEIDRQRLSLGERWKETSNRKGTGGWKAKGSAHDSGDSATEGVGVRKKGHRPGAPDFPEHRETVLVSATVIYVRQTGKNLSHEKILKENVPIRNPGAYFQ